MTRTHSTFITYDPTKKHFQVSPVKSIHQRDAFVNNGLNSSLNVLRHVKEETGNQDLGSGNQGSCNKSLCS